MGFNRIPGDLDTIGEAFAASFNLEHFNDLIPRHLGWVFHTIDFSKPGVLVFEGADDETGEDVDMRIVIDEISLDADVVVHKA